MINIRSFDWRDLPVLHRYRNSGLFLNTALALTRGPVLVPTGAVLSAAGLGGGVYTYLCDDDEVHRQPLLAQVTHNAGSTFARLSFLAPEEAIASADLPLLFDYLASAVGERGVFHILAEVDERAQAFDALRRSGFAIYATQRIWKLQDDLASKPKTSGWRRCNGQDVLRVRSLYNDLVPGLVQQVEPLPREHMKGMVYYQDGVMRAYVELRYGRVGIWMQPFIHPDAHDFDATLGELLHTLPGRRGRTVYVCIRSYQSWLEGMVEAVGAVPGTSQAVMVRHLSVARRAAQPVALPSINGTRAEPIAHIMLNPDKRDQ
jgi:hypothetical protein